MYVSGGRVKPSGSVSQPAGAAEKWSVFAGLGLLLAVPYFAIQHHLLFAASVVPSATIDRLVPFFQPAIYLYVSFYLFLTLPLLLARDRHDLCQMALGFAWIACTSHVLFFVWPTALPSLISSGQVTNPLLRLIMAVDRNLNACPSLHASLAIYCALCSVRLVKSRAQRSGIWVWTFLILLSTLLTKRHVALDLLAGAVLALAAYAALFTAQESDVAGSPALQATLTARAALVRGHEDELALLTAQDWRKRAGELLCFALAAACGIWLTIVSLTASHSLLAVVGIVVTAVALNAFVLLMHDGMHGTLFATPAKNWAGSVLLGSTFLMSFSAYRVMHTRHHKFLGDPRDPDDYHNYIRHPAAVWALHFVRLTFGSLLYLIAIPLLAIRFGTEEERRRILVEYGLLLAIYSVVVRFVPLSILAIVWFIPLLIVGNLTAIRGFTQHGITDATDPYIASRTILPHALIGFLLLNENYHLEHHLFPEVPSYHLPQLHKLIWPQLPRAVSDRGYLRFLAKFLRATPRLDETPIGLEHPAAKST
jgi:fatty acid desaturase